MSTHTFAQRFWASLTGRSVPRWHSHREHIPAASDNAGDDLLSESHLNAESRRLLASAGLVMEGSIIMVSAGVEASQPHATLVPIMGRLANSTGAARVMPAASANTPKTLVGEGEFFAIKVNGDAMAEAAIRDGDVAFIRAQSTAEAGQVVAVLINDEAVIRELEIDDVGNAWLKPRNDAYATIRAADAIILGRVATIIRRL